MAAFTTYQAALDYLFNFTDYERMHRVTKATSVFGLSRMNKLLEHCGNPQDQLRTVHIAGTKGKGSTAAMLASVLRAAGLKVGLYTSPHIVDIRERIQIDGEWIPEQAVVDIMNRLHPYLQVAAKGGDTYAPTFFETFTVIAFLHFLEQQVDVAIFEVGLGGRLDATNVLRPEACAITPISFDHTDKLGNTLGEIAGEKAGIVKSGVPVISGVQQPEALDVIRAKCAELDASLRVVGEDIAISCAAERGEAALECGGLTPLSNGRRPAECAAHQPEPSSLVSGRDTARQGGVKPPHSIASPVFSLHTWRRELDSITVPLIGRHQRENAATAVGLADLLCERGFEISDDHIRSGIASVEWPARIQTVSTEPEIIVDGAHNAASATVLAEALAGLPPKRTVFVFGVAADKDAPAMLSILGPGAGAFVFTRTSNPRAADPDQLRAMLAEACGDVESHAAPTAAEALDLARSLVDPDGRIVVAGSMYLAGDALAALA
jgi:dihydrofolate synthase / folylpolyglutamate synthase